MTSPSGISFRTDLSGRSHDDATGQSAAALRVSDADRLALAVASRLASALWCRADQIARCARATASSQQPVIVNCSPPETSRTSLILGCSSWAGQRTACIFRLTSSIANWRTLPAMPSKNCWRLTSRPSPVRDGDAHQEPPLFVLIVRRGTDDLLQGVPPWRRLRPAPQRPDKRSRGLPPEARRRCPPAH